MVPSSANSQNSIALRQSGGEHAGATTLLNVGGSLLLHTLCLFISLMSSQITLVIALYSGLFIAVHVGFGGRCVVVLATDLLQ